MANKNRIKAKKHLKRSGNKIARKTKVGDFPTAGRRNKLHLRWGK